MRKFLKVFGNLLERICYYVSFISMFCMAFMCVLMTADVLLSLLFNYRIMGAYELTSLSLVFLVFSSWAYTQTQHGHIHVTMIISRFPQKLKFICYSITSLLSFLTMCLASIGVYNCLLQKLSNGDKTANLLIPTWPAVLVELLAFILMGICLLKDCIESFYAIVDKETADEISSTWV